MATVRYRDREPNGLAMLLGGLIEANLAADPDRERLLKPATVAVVATDVDTSVTFRFKPGVVMVGNGIVGNPDVVVEGDSETLSELSSVPLRWGFPDALTPEGKRTYERLGSGELRVTGMLTHPLVLSRLNRLLSVV